jgi:hypothetical protein
MLCLRLLGEGKPLSTVTPEDGIAGKPIFYSAKDGYLLSAATVEYKALSAGTQLHRLWSFLLR